MNIDLMRRVRDQIVAHPELHDQGDWEIETPCGTKRCIAGWTAHLSGKEITGGVLDPALVDGIRVEDWAADALGLTDHQAMGLFFAGRNEDALELLNGYIEGRY